MFPERAQDHPSIRETRTGAGAGFLTGVVTRLSVTALPGIVVVTVTRTELGDDWAPEHVPTKYPVAEQEFATATISKDAKTKTDKTKVNRNFDRTMLGSQKS